MESMGVTSPVLEYQSAETARADTTRLSTRLVAWALLLVVSTAAVAYGIKLRRDIWDWTAKIHFYGDVANGYRWGWNANRLKLFHVYDDVASGKDVPAISSLDYTPLRLAAVTWWVHWAEPKFDGLKAWRDDYDVTAPMLWGNTIAELVSSILVFLLIRMWIVRMKGPGFFRGAIPGLIGALIFWFNPAVLWDGHAWPQWDVWLVPWFLGAVLLACLDGWFVAGICLAIGASLKGQLLLGAPVILIWPLVQLRFSAVFRIIVGVVFGTMMIVFPWLLLSERGFVWFALAICAIGLISPIALRWKLSWAWMTGLGVVAMLLAWPWTSVAPLHARLACVALVGLVALSRFVPFKLVPHCYALAIALLAILTIPVYTASSTWFTRGFMFGTERYETMVSGTGTYNLPELLMTYFGWPRVNDPNTPAYLPFIDQPITFRQQMSIIYGICVLLAGIGAAIHYRRRDTRFLVAMVAPWVIFYCLLPQMHGRYLIWGAAMCALLAGAGVGLTLLGILISLISLNGILENQDRISGLGDFLSQTVRRNLFALHPHLGWALLLMAAILLYYAFVPRTKSTLM